MIGQRGEGRSASAHNPFTYSIPSYPIHEFLYMYISLLSSSWFVAERPISRGGD